MKLMIETPASEPLFKSPNHLHMKWIGPILVGWAVAKTNWGYRNPDGQIVNAWAGFKTCSRYKHKFFFHIIVYKLCISILFSLP